MFRTLSYAVPFAATLLIVTCGPSRSSDVANAQEGANGAALVPSSPSAPDLAPSASASAPPTAPTPSYFCPDDMVFVAGGQARIGSNEPDAHPPRIVVLSPYCIDRTEVTVEAYARCVAAGTCAAIGSEPFANDCRYPETRPDRARNCLRSQQAEEYSATIGRHLPTEAQWEVAATGGDRRSRPWGHAVAREGQVNACTETCEFGARDHDGDYGDGFANAAPVGVFPDDRSPSGALDMLGNVREWTADWYVAQPPLGAMLTDPTGPPAADFDNDRVIRGSSFQNDPPEMSLHERASRTEAVEDVGFRCASLASPLNGGAVHTLGAFERARDRPWSERAALLAPLRDLGDVRALRAASRLRDVFDEAGAWQAVGERHPRVVADQVTTTNTPRPLVPTPPPRGAPRIALARGRDAWVATNTSFRAVTAELDRRRGTPGGSWIVPARHAMHDIPVIEATFSDRVDVRDLEGFQQPHVWRPHPSSAFVVLPLVDRASSDPWATEIGRLVLLRLADDGSIAEAFGPIEPTLTACDDANQHSHAWARADTAVTRDRGALAVARTCGDTVRRVWILVEAARPTVPLFLETVAR